MLHGMFDSKIKNTAEYVERLMAVCDIADGQPWSSSRLRDEKPEDQIKRKAFEVLAHNFFKKREEYQPWVRSLRWYPPEALKKMIWFFRPNDSVWNEEGCGLLNVSGSGDKSESKHLALTFLRELI